MLDPVKLRNPFKGLRPYTSDDREILFGRDGDLSLILDRLLSNKTTLLFAGSGVGKTSFLNAKVMPELQDTHVVCYHSRWAEQEPLRSVRTALAKVLTGGANTERDDRSLLDICKKGSPLRSLLVLDQFEEVFQYHKDTDYFDAFLSGISELIIAPGPDVRVVFAMREEFLGELSVFDNRIPDLFNNYYRLKNPTAKQARDIIQLTCASVGVACDGRGLAELLDDLLSVDIESPQPSSRAGTTHVGNKRRRQRDHVPPPYLQIACHRLWKPHAVSAETAGGKATFLGGYERGGAARELGAYCQEKLAALPLVQQEMAADAFSYLMTKQGAKMAYELTHLAEHMRVKEPILRETLTALSDAEVRILRRSSGPDGGTWFELYHDMYAPFVSRWKGEFETVRRARQAQEEIDRREAAVSETLAAVRVHTRGWITSTVLSLFGLPFGAVAIMIFLRRTRPPTPWRRVIGVGVIWILSWLVGILLGLLGLGVLVGLGVVTEGRDTTTWDVIAAALLMVVLPALLGAGGALLFWHRARSRPGSGHNALTRT